MPKPNPEDFGLDLSDSSLRFRFDLDIYADRVTPSDLKSLKSVIWEMQNHIKFLESLSHAKSLDLIKFIKFTFELAGSMVLLAMICVTIGTFLFLGLGLVIEDPPNHGLFYTWGFLLASFLLFLVFEFIKQERHKAIDNRATLDQIANKYDLPTTHYEASVLLKSRARILSEKLLPYWEAASRYYDTLDREGEGWWTSKAGTELEKALYDLFYDTGHSATLTKGSGDGGVDVIVETNSRTYLIQSKGWQSRVGVPTIRELAGVVAHTPHREPIGVVLGTGGFTAEAEKFASDSGVLLWGPETLTKIAKGQLTLK